MYKQSKAGKIYLTIIVIAGVFAIGAQFYLSMQVRETSFIEAVIRFFSYFTILTNILVTFCSATVLICPRSAWGRFFSNPPVISAITVYIFIVSLVYNLILRQIWDPTGLQKVVDELLHVIIPALFLLFWIIFLPKKNLSWNILSWQIYPLLYLFYTLIRGASSGFYPYPFLDAGSEGYPHVLFNIVILALIFMGFSLVLVGIGKLLSRGRNN